MNIGFIGLGRMGRAMAGRLLAAGHALMLYNRSPGSTDELAAGGAEVAPSVAVAAARGEIVITMLTDDAALDAVVGPGGLLEALRPGAVHVAMGTHSVAATAAMRDRHRDAGKLFVAAPVLGRPQAAAAGQIVVVAGGPPDALVRCRPLFAVLGRRIFEAGSDSAAAAAMKVTNNFLLGAAIEALGEAFSLVRRYGVAPATFYDMVTDGLFSSPAYKIYGQIMVDDDFDRVGVTAAIGLKDANLALQAGEAVGVPLPTAAVWRDRLVSAVAQGDGGRDWAVMARVQERACGASQATTMMPAGDRRE